MVKCDKQQLFEELVKKYDWDVSDPVAEYNEFIEFQELSPKVKFVPFTVDVCRANIGKEIPTHFQNGGLSPDNMLFGPTMLEKVSDRNNLQKIFDTVFIPNGDAQLGKKVVKGWLANPENITQNFTRKAADNFYLLGKIKFLPDKKFSDWEVGLVNAKTGHLATNGSGDSWVEQR